MFFHCWYNFHYDAKNPSLPKKPIFYDGYMQARLNYAKEWKRYYIVITSDNKKKKKNLFQKKSTVINSLSDLTAANTGHICFYHEKEDAKKKQPIIEIDDVSQVYAVWPEKPEIVESGAGGVVKVEGNVLFAKELPLPVRDFSNHPNSTYEARPESSFALFMLPNIVDLAKCIIAVMGSFSLSPYGSVGKQDPELGDGSKDIGLLTDEFPENVDPTEVDIRTWGLLYLSTPEVQNVIKENDTSLINTKNEFAEILKEKRTYRLNKDLESFRNKVNKSIHERCSRERVAFENHWNGLDDNGLNTRMNNLQINDNVEAKDESVEEENESIEEKAVNEGEENENETDSDTDSDDDDDETESESESEEEVKQPINNMNMMSPVVMNNMQMGQMGQMVTMNGQQYALVAQPVMSEDGTQIVNWTYNYQLVDPAQYQVKKKKI